MKNLRDMIDTGCPMIYAGNWKAENAKGWRWATNLDDEADNSKMVIEDYLTAHGKTNVTLGHAFDQARMRPTPLATYCGLYVRDVEDIIREVTRSLDDLNSVARWLSGKKDAA